MNKKSNDVVILPCGKHGYCPHCTINLLGHKLQDSYPQCRAPIQTLDSILDQLDAPNRKSKGYVRTLASALYTKNHALNATSERQQHDIASLSVVQNRLAHNLRIEQISLGILSYKN